LKLDTRRAVVDICLLGIEACGLYLLLDMLNTVTIDSALSVLGLLALYPVSFIVNKALGCLHWYSFILFIISWMLWAVAFLLMIKFQMFPGISFFNPEWVTAFPRALIQLLVAFKPEILIFLSSILLWWMGKRMAVMERTYAKTLTEFQFWLFIIIILLLSASGFDIELHNAVFIVICFFFISLAGISIAHTLEGKSRLSGLPSGHWIAMLLISIAIVLITGVLIALLFTPDLLRLIVSGVQWIMGVIWDFIMMVLQWIASLLPHPDPGELPPVTPGTAMSPPPEENIGFQIPEAVRTAMQILWSTLVGGLLIMALWSIAKQLFDRLQRKTNTRGARTKAMRGAFKEDIMTLFRNLWKALIGIFSRQSSENASPESPGTVLTRQIYRSLLRWAAKHKYGRALSQTPQEFCEMISGLIPDARAELIYVTNHYVNVRYGLAVPSKEEQEQLHRSWLIIKKKHLRAPKAAHWEDTSNEKNAINNG